jgi:hypothetical protein
LEGKASAPIVSGCSQNYCPDDIDSTCPSTWNWLRCDVNENNNTCENRSCYDVEEN